MHTALPASAKWEVLLQIFVVALDESLVVLFCLLAVVLVEFNTRILLGQPHTHSRAVGGISVWIRRNGRLAATYRPVARPRLHPLRSPAPPRVPDWDQTSEIRSHQQIVESPANNYSRKKEL